MNNTTLANRLFAELETRARRINRDRLAAQTITKHKRIKKNKASGGSDHTISPYISTNTQPQTTEDRVQNYFANLGDSLSPEEWAARQVEITALQMLPEAEQIRRHRATLGDLFDGNIPQGEGTHTNK